MCPAHYKLHIDIDFTFSMNCKTMDLFMWAHEKKNSMGSHFDPYIFCLLLLAFRFLWSVTCNCWDAVWNGFFVILRPCNSTVYISQYYNSCVLFIKKKTSSPKNHPRYFYDALPVLMMMRIKNNTVKLRSLLL